jgi:3-hydroxyacyl-[acyl-carrier-protein] dehydratase
MVPGVLLVEGMAQTAGIAVGGPGKNFLLTAIRSMKFLRPVRPEELLSFRACKVGEAGGLVQCSVEARVGQDLVAEGQIILADTSRQGAPGLKPVQSQPKNERNNAPRHPTTES